MKRLIDMNLSPDWVDELQFYGWYAVHWSSAVGAPAATDRTIMDWAREHDYMVFTRDLDFGAVLAVTRALGPSVIQVRTQDVMPKHLDPLLASMLRQHQPVLEKGALIIVDEAKSRVRLLPL
jgi:predicted nuclease of predicted toxin-antitoxin system